MSSTFSITAVNNNVAIDNKSRQKSATFTVTNSSGQAVRGRASLATTPEMAPHLAWLSFDPRSETERPFGISATEQYIVNVNVPADAAPGNYAFRLNMVATYNPDETFSPGPSVTIVVPEPPKNERKFPIWIIPVVLVALVVIVAIVLLATRSKNVVVPDVVGLSEDAAVTELEDIGLEIGRLRSETSGTITLDHITRTDPPAGAEAPKGSKVDLYLSSGAVATPAPTAAPPTPLPPPTLPPPPSPILAKYPLQSDARDSSGHQADATLTNAPFQDGGVYCNGVYVYTAGGCQVSTGALTGFNYNAFAIRADFKVGAAQRMPVFVGGASWRWIGFYLNADGTTSLLYNNANLAPCTTNYSLNTWHTAWVTYNGSEARLYLDGVQGCSVNFTLEQGGDTDVSVTNFSNASTFQGTIRNLIIYSEPITP